MLIDEVTEYVLSRKISYQILDYTIGAKYSYVIVKGPYGSAMGTAYMPQEDLTRGVSRVPSISSLSEMLSSINILERSLGIALLNAISQYLLWNEGDFKKYRMFEKNLVEYIPEICQDCRKLVIIGNMVPLVRKLQEKGFEVTVLERNPRFRGGALPDIMAPRVVPQAEGVIITGTAFINDTVDYILSLARNAEIRILVGPSGAIHPEPLLRYFTHVASLKIIDEKNACKTIKLGGGRWDFTPYAREYIVERKK